MALTRNRFPKIIAELQPRIGAAVKASAGLVEVGAKERVPVNTGKLKDAIHIERQGQLAYSVIAGSNDVFYGHLVEHGGAHTAPRPFLVPALETAKPEAVAAVTAALRGL